MRPHAGLLNDRRSSHWSQKPAMLFMVHVNAKRRNALTWQVLFTCNVDSCCCDLLRIDEVGDGRVNKSLMGITVTPSDGRVQVSVVCKCIARGMMCEIDEVDLSF